jgi:hypothetical protein
MLNMNHAYILLNLLDNKEIIEKYKPRTLSTSCGITWNLVLERSDIKWDYGILCENPNITWDIIRANLDKEWNYFYLSSNPNITWDIIQTNPDIRWSYDELSKNPNITWSIVQDNPDKEWNYLKLSKNPNITWDIVQANPDREWFYSLLSMNPNITPDIINANSNKGWDYISTGYNPNISLRTAMKISTNCYSKSIVYTNPSFTTKQLGGDIEYAIENPNITWKDIHYNGIKLGYHYITNKLIRYNSAQKIQNTFRKWSRRPRLESSTQVLLQTCIGVYLPIELIYHISSLHN